jgi:hypothetical protein
MEAKLSAIDIRLNWTKSFRLPHCCFAWTLCVFAFKLLGRLLHAVVFLEVKVWLHTPTSAIHKDLLSGVEELALRYVQQ